MESLYCLPAILAPRRAIRASPEPRYHGETHEEGFPRAEDRRDPAGTEVEGRDGAEGEVSHERGAGRPSDRRHVRGRSIRPRCRRERLRRPGRRDRRPDGGPPSAFGDSSREGRTRSADAHLLHGGDVRALHRPGGAHGGDLPSGLDEIERAINQPEVAGRVAAILAEPVQGEGGMIVPPKEFFPLLRKLCDAHGIVLVDDEVQAGMGRTGKLWAIENWNTVPDILVSGKAVGGGLPFGGVTGKPAVMDRPGPGSLGGTFGGNPIVCAAALEAIDVIQKALPKTRKLEALIGKRLDEIFEDHDRVGEVRGIGAMWALEFVKDRRTKEPDVELARAVQLAGLKNGLILLTAGFFNNCIRLLPPINIPLPLMTRALDLLEDSL